MTTDLVKELRANAPATDDRLCVDLLAAEGHWFTRPDFVQACAKPTDNGLWLDPIEAITFAQQDRLSSRSQRAFLHLALALAVLYEIDLYTTLPVLDPHQLNLVLNGMMRHIKRTQPILIDGALAARLPLDLEASQ